jgi:glycosyltransferase involved in cell wall biosynthesis
VDDGSTDLSPNIVRTFEDKRIKLIQQKNAGVSSARNRGIAESIGYIVAFLDSDDEWEERFLENIFRMSIKFPGEGFFATGYKRKYLHSSVDVSINNENEILNIDSYLSLSLKFPIIHTSSIAVKKKIFENVGFFGEGYSFGEDQDMWLRIAMKYNLVFCKEILSIFYCENSSFSCHDKKTMEKIHPIVTTIKNIVTNSHFIPIYRRSLIIKYANKKVIERALLNVMHNDLRLGIKIFNENIIRSSGSQLVFFLYETGMKQLHPRIIYIIYRLINSRIGLVLKKFTLKEDINIVIKRERYIQQS